MALPITFYTRFLGLGDDGRKSVFEQMAKSGAKHIVLTDAMITAIFMNPKHMQLLQRAVADAGLTFVDAHAPFGIERDPNTHIPEFRRQLATRHCLAIEICAEMGVKTITIHVGNAREVSSGSVADHIDRAEEAFSRILPTAERCGVTVCIENIWFCNNTPECLLELKRRLPTEALGFCYDAGHANLMARGKDYPDSIVWERWKPFGLTPRWDNQILEKMLPYVTTCHLHDNSGISDEHMVPGCGSVDWNHIMPLLLTAPRLKCIQCEANPWRYDEIKNPCEVSVNAMLCLAKAWNIANP